MGPWNLDSILDSMRLNLLIEEEKQKTCEKHAKLCN